MKTTIDKAPECLNTNDKAMWVLGWNEAVDALKEALAQPEQKPAVPEGWKLVPIKPTLAMVNTLADTDPEHESVWEAVLAAAPEQEPVAHIGMINEDHFADVCRKAGGNSNTQLYTSPPKREWVGLTDTEWEAMYDKHAAYQEEGAVVSGWDDFAQAIEAKLKELNHDN